MTRDDDLTRAEFRALAAEHRVIQVTCKVQADGKTPLSAYRKLAANRPSTFLLVSAENGRSWSRWSFIGAGSPAALTVRDGRAVWLGEVREGAPSGGDPLQALTSTLQLLATPARPGLPPLSGGMVGFFAYDLVRVSCRRMAVYLSRVRMLCSRASKYRRGCRCRDLRWPGER
ncbi:hypothetical protein TUM20983_37920 [Mycobacterium antarcticum]|nr:hypothetical protein TUM20983_37920 [Mycolicibacterium sp. TUM20983]